MIRYGMGYGLGFRGTSSAWPYIGRGRGGLPRCWYPGFWTNWGTANPFITFTQGGQTEIEYLKQTADALRQQLGRIEARINDLQKENN